ncbi:hypothetical protein DSCW_32720 [Desulfosarcina widdelii]|uniref:Uncharacterized protein n=1 Tax=Desulfosarcina widdelii TaxID=947919 RepID=A0A5K7Z574_9BACT|nr:hypothetical protein [Desulfosarcina widdelii]BBO75855.1 hypothetical protein DSCW_32720 [Desulfosarcina widdelii]
MEKMPPEVEKLIGPQADLEKARDLLSMMLQAAPNRDRRNQISVALQVVTAAQRAEGTLPRDLWRC